MKKEIANDKVTLIAEEGYVFQSVTDGLVLGDRLLLGKNDDAKHYHEIPKPSKVEELT